MSTCGLVVCGVKDLFVYFGRKFLSFCTDHLLLCLYTEMFEKVLGEKGPDASKTRFLLFFICFFI